jgi:hypothetical protein
MHGGARGSSGPKGTRNGNYKHGRYTAEAIASRRWLRQFTRDVRELTKPASALRTMRRREFITFLGRAWAAQPLTTHGQTKRMRRIGVLMG